MTTPDTLAGLRFLRDLHRDLIDSYSIRQDSPQSANAIFVFQNTVKDLIARVEAALKETA